MNYKSKFKMICYIICALFIITKPACALEDSLTYDTKDNKQLNASINLEINNNELQYNIDTLKAVDYIKCEIFYVDFSGAKHNVIEEQENIQKLENKIFSKDKKLFNGSLKITIINDNKTFTKEIKANDSWNEFKYKAKNGYEVVLYNKTYVENNKLYYEVFSTKKMNFVTNEIVLKTNKNIYNYKISNENTLYIKDSIDINNGETLVDATLKTLVNDNGIKESTAKLIK